MRRWCVRMIISDARNVFIINRQDLTDLDFAYRCVEKSLTSIVDEVSLSSSSRFAWCDRLAIPWIHSGQISSTDHYSSFTFCCTPCLVLLSTCRSADE